MYFFPVHVAFFLSEGTASFAVMGNPVSFHGFLTPGSMSHCHKVGCKSHASFSVQLHFLQKVAVGCRNKISGSRSARAALLPVHSHTLLLLPMAKEITS